MPVFFNGRLIVSPATASAIDDSGLANKNLSVGNVLAILGPSNGGKPFEPLRFGRPSEAREVLRSGLALKAVEKAFDASAELGSPQEIVFVRVNPATASTLDLMAGGTLVAQLASTDYGLHTRNIRVKVEAGSTRGKKLTTQVGTASFSQDNVARDAFSVTYSGGTAATLTVSALQVLLSSSTGDVLADVSLELYQTVGAVVERLNSVANVVATVLDASDELVARRGLDSLTAATVDLTPRVVTANLQAAVDWFNSQGEGLVTATREPVEATAPLDNLPFTNLAGGVDGTPTVADFQRGYDVLQTVDVQWVVPLSGSAAVHAMNDAHTSFMSNVGAMERRGVVGTALATSDADAILAAKAINSDRTSLVHLGFYDYDESGALTLFPAYLLAAMIGGGFCGANPATPLTNKSLKIRGLERRLRNPTDTDQLIKGGVLAVEENVRGFRVVQSISTWLNNTNYNRVEQSVGVGYDFVSRNVRQALDVLRGQKATPQLLGRAVNITDSQLRELARPEPIGPGVLVGDAQSPPYKNISASIEGDVIRVQFEAAVALPANYVLVAIFAVPYSGTASL